MTAATVPCPCPHCSHVTRIPVARLPERPVAFACPRCKKKVVADRAKLLGPEASATQNPTAASAPAAASAAAPTAAAVPAAAATQAPPVAGGKPVGVQTVASTVGSFLQPPPDAVFPSGIILGENDDAIAEVREALRVLGSELKLVSSPDAARDAVLNEQPEICIYVAGSVDTFPHPPLSPLTSLSSRFRRRLYVVLVADDVRTLDGNAAFALQVNMTLARQDISSPGPALYTGLEYHRRLYAPFFAAEDAHAAY